MLYRTGLHRTNSTSTGQVSHPDTVVYSPAPRKVWRKLFQADQDALPTQSPEWLDCVCAAGGYQDASRLYETADGQLIVLPMARRSLVSTRLSILGAMPAHWGFGGLLASTRVTARLVSVMLDDLFADPALRIHLTPNPLLAAAWESATAERPRITEVRCTAHVLDLEGGFARVWQERFRSNTRSQVRRAERLGVAVETDTSGQLVPIFYELLQKSTDRWANQQHEPRALTRYRGRRRDSFAKFEAIAKHMGQRCRVSVAYYGGQPASSIMVLQDGANVEYFRGVMDKPLASRCHANSLLHKLAIEDACRQGCRFYHMGETGKLEGLARYKSRLGATPHSYAEYWLERVPITSLDRALRNSVKRMIGFQDT